MASVDVHSMSVFIAIVYSWFVGAPIVCGGLVLVLCFVLQYPVSFLVLQIKAKKELVVLLLLCFECRVAVIVLCLFLAVPWVGL